MEVAMPYGYNGKILHVDLTKGLLTVEEPQEAFYRKYLGGRGMGMYYILRDMPKGADPVGPEKGLTVIAGVTTGGGISGKNRLNAHYKPPGNGGIGGAHKGENVFPG